MRAGIILFYAVLGAFILLERAWPGGGEGVMLLGGRIFASLAALVYFGAYTGTLTRDQLLEQLYGGDPAQPAARLLGLVNKILLYVSLPAAAWLFYELRLWDGLMMLAYPAWVVWLKLELRRTDIAGGALKPAAVWRILTTLSATALAGSLALTLGGYPGPTITIGNDYYRLLPMVLLAALPATITFALLSGFFGRHTKF